MSTLLALSLAPVAVVLVWYLTTTLTQTQQSALPSTLRNKRIILLIAHPDDEAMFFAPTLQRLTAPDLGNHVKILCLSTGNADGLGETRKHELVASALTLGLRRKEDVFVMDDARFQDGMKNEWKADDVAHVLAQAFAPQLIQPTASPPRAVEKSRSSKDSKDRDRDRDRERADRDKTKRPSKHHRSSSSLSNSNSNNNSVPTGPTSTTGKHHRTSSSSPPSPASQPRATIDTLITFDGSGVSGHANHIALFHGSRLFLSKIMRGHSAAEHACPVTLYTLTSVSLVRKYSFVLDAPVTFVSSALFSSPSSPSSSSSPSISASSSTSKSPSTSPSTSPSPGPPDPAASHVVFLNDVPAYLAARRAMVSAHRSQMRWFRHAWVVLARYMVVNDLRTEEGWSEGERERDKAGAGAAAL